MWARALAGIFPGFFFAAALTGLVTWALPGPWTHALVPSMVAFVPAWMLVALWAFSFRTPWRAWGWISGGAAVGFSVLWLARTQGWMI